MIAAGRDHIADVRFERLLRDELAGYGVRVTYVELPWADHAFEDVAAGFHDRHCAVVRSSLSGRCSEVSERRTSALRAVALVLLAIFFAAAGINHFAHPALYAGSFRLGLRHVPCWYK